MNQLAPLTPTYALPTLIAAAGVSAARCFLEFFAANIRSPHTRRAYSRAVADFLTWCDAHGVPSIATVQPLHVATWMRYGRGLYRPRQSSSSTWRRSVACSIGW
jgi:site-specific recombinase XerD